MALLLSAITPFGVVIACVVLAGVWAWSRLDHITALPSNLYLARLIWTIASGLPLLCYAVWVTSVDPFLRAWNQQNLTPSPQLADLIISFSPIVLLAGLGSWWLIRNRR